MQIKWTEQGTIRQGIVCVPKRWKIRLRHSAACLQTKLMRTRHGLLTPAALRNIQI